MDVMTMKKSDFAKVPLREGWASELPACHSVVIIPERRFHDSGFRCITLVGCNKENEPLFRTHGCSDVINMDGIGGYGKWNPEIGLPKFVKPKGWSIDCLPCGYFRIFCNSVIELGCDLSSMEIWGTESKYR